MNKRPNFILISADNLGYGDWGCFGSTAHRTPHTDRMAAEGMKLTHFYSSSGVCTPSRASLMTGCYPRRIGMHVSATDTCVLMPIDAKGLNPSEVTVARVLRDAGYATACVGKWHLGDQPPFLPTRHGFDSYFGIPYSDDMVQRESRPDWPPLPLMRDEEVVDAPVDRDTLTRRYTEETVKLIRANHDRPFFIYLAHAMPGSTTHPFAHPEFQGKSSNGRYGDAIEEMDWSTGQILDTLEELGIDDNTLIMTTSDHGPIRQEPRGCALPLKGYGYDTSEGAFRPPCVVRWPAAIAPGSECSEVTSVLDIMPTFARLAGTTPPQDRTIDGHDMTPLLRGEPDAASGHDDTGYFYYQVRQLQAVRSGPWKLYLALDDKIQGLSRETAPSEAELYNLIDDVGEEHNVVADHPDVVERLLALAERARAELGDVDRLGAGQRPAGWIDDPQPCVMK